MRILLLFLTFFMVSEAMAAPYYRFWRGYKRAVHVRETLGDDGKPARDADGYKLFQDDPTRPMTWTGFADLVNRWLIPATTSCCAESSLVGYLPALLPRGGKPAKLHDEIALIVYRSEDAYKKTREDKANREAVTYGPLHGDVFAIGNIKSPDEEVRAATSRSLVPKPFTGNVDLAPAADNNQLPEVSYDVLGTSPDWQSGYTIVRVSLKKENTKLADCTGRYLREVRDKAEAKDLLGFTVLVTEDYVIEYQNFKSENAARAFKMSAQFRVLKDSTKPYMEMRATPAAQAGTATELRYQDLDFGAAASVQFTPGKKPTPAMKHHRLE